MRLINTLYFAEIYYAVKVSDTTNEDSSNAVQAQIKMKLALPAALGKSIY